MSDRLTEEELKKFYQGTYVQDFDAKADACVSRLLPYFTLRRSDRVADFGCGNGRLLPLISSSIDLYIGVDFSEEFIASAHAKAASFGITNAKFECGDIKSFCHRHPAEFDKAFTLDFSEHIYDEMFLEIYSSIRNSMKDRGQLYLHTPDGDYVLEIMKRIGLMKQFPEHIAVRNGRANTDLLTRAGFRNIRVLHLAHYLAPMSYAHFLSKFPWIGKYWAARLLIICEKN